MRGFSSENSNSIAEPVPSSPVDIGLLSSDRSAQARSKLSGSRTVTVTELPTTPRLV